MKVIKSVSMDIELAHKVEHIKNFSEYVCLLIKKDLEDKNE